MSIDFLELSGRSVLVFGVANRKSVAYQTGRLLEQAGANVVYVVRSEARRTEVAKLLGGERRIYVCDVEFPEQIDSLRSQLGEQHEPFHGVFHSIAFGDYGEKLRPFHETTKSTFLRAIDISCYSLIALANALSEQIDKSGSVVTVSISTTEMASENYGFMAPAKAALDSTIVFLAKSFSRFSRVRFNAVAPGLLKTSASAGIPGYVDAYLYAESVIPRGEALRTDEVANAAAFLLSPRSSGINGQRIVLDAGMAWNYFDRDLVQRSLDGPEGPSERARGG